MMSNEVFPMIPYSGISCYLTIVIAVITVICSILATYYFYRCKKYPRVLFIITLITTIAVSVLLVYLGYSTRNVTFALSDQGLQINGGLYGRNVSKNAIIIDGARIVTLQDENSYAPCVRTNGIGLPGYSRGWFKLNNGEKALLFLTSRSSVVYIPTKLGYSILLSPTKPKEFLRTMRELWEN